MANLEIPEDLDLSNLNDKQKIMLLDKVFFKILASETDFDFEENLRIYLPKLLIKLATSEEIVRKKIMEIFVHINKRIKSRPTVQLPLDELLNMFNNPSFTNLAFFANFSSIYIKLSFPRLSSKEKANMVERLFESLEGKSNAHLDLLISLITDGIRYLELKQNDKSNKEKFGLLNSPKLRKYVLDYFFYCLLLPYSSTNTANKIPVSSNVNSNTSLTAGSVVDANSAFSASASTTTPFTQANEIPACLSENIYKRYKNDLNLENGDEIEQLKIGILKFLSFSIYECEDILFHFIVSTSDTRYSVVQIAEIHIKRIVGSVDLNDQTIVNQFLHIFMGNKSKLLPAGSTATSDGNKIEPANTRIRLKLFPYMLRSRTASCTMPQAIQLVFDCLFGPNLSTNQKIKNYAVQFVHAIALNCDAEKLAKIGVVLIQGMNKLIVDSKDDSKLRGLAYVGVGKLARKLPNIIVNDISIVHNFFSCLEKEDVDTKLHIQEALVLMIDALKSSNNEQKSLLLCLLFQYIENDVSHCRSMAVKYAFEIFEQDHLESRYLLLLATSDAKEEIRQEAVKYLHRAEDGDGKELNMASFQKWVDFISNKIDDRLKRNYKVYTFGTHTLAFYMSCYQEILVVLRLALSKSAGLKPQVIDSKSLDSIRDETPLLAKYINELSRTSLDCLFKYVNIIKEYSLTAANSLGIYLLLEICSISPFNITKFLKEDLEWLKNQSFSVNEQVRFYSAELWSLVFINSFTEKIDSPNRCKPVSSINFDPFFSSLSAMKQTILLNNKKSFETKHGCILCIGYAIGKYYNITKSFGCKDEQTSQIKALITSIVAYLDDPNLSVASIISLGEIARNGSLVFENWEKLYTLVEILYKKILTTKETTKVKEKAATTLGYMCVNPIILLDKQASVMEYEIPDTKLAFDSFSKFIMYKLLNSAQAKQFELHMAIGDALVNCALGKKSKASLNNWTTMSDETDEESSSNLPVVVHQNQEKELVREEDYSDIEWLLHEIINTYLPSQNQHLRQAACFWLLALLKKCAKTNETVLRNVYKIQDAFIQKLGENDEITQEVASKGIGILFSITNEEQKEALVSRLVDALGGGNSSKKKGQSTANAKSSTTVTSADSGFKITNENEEIFGKDQIGKTPEGTNITTYKELCSLASDLNKPDLIYQFMNLAHHNSIWNTRRGAAFGFGTIVSMSSQILQPYLASIVPKLFRYQFDPNLKIQQSMSSIWHGLIKSDNKKIVDQYLTEILVDIEQNMLSPLWRVRESCCAALCDLIKGGRNLESISMKFGSFWSLLFKLADDIKESVRVSAELTLRSLQRVTISYSTSVSNINVCQQTISSVLPILIVDGLQSNIEEVRNISVLTIRDLIKMSSSGLIRPYLIDMNVNLLETLSGYEPPDLNYIALKLSSQESAQERLDHARIAASKNTPMIEIINMSLEHMKDDEQFAELIPRLVDIIKKGLGVSTKAGVCHIITSLVEQQPAKMSPYSGKLMGVLVNVMSTETNKTINKCYCSTIGSVVRIAKESSVENLIAKLQEWYLEKENDGIKQSCGFTLLAMAQNANEMISGYLKKCIPFVFFAMHQQQVDQLKQKQQLNQQQLQTIQSVWDEVFDEITTGTEYAIRANLAEILGFVKNGLDHQSWKLRIQAALCVCTISNKLQSNIDPDRLNDLLRMLISALNTKTWSGKDRLLIAISSVFNNCKLKLGIENVLIDEILTAVFKEAIKQSSNIELTYRQCSLRCLADLIQFTSSHFKDNYFEQYWTLFVVKYFEQDLENLQKKDVSRLSQQVVLFKSKNRGLAAQSEVEMETADSLIDEEMQVSDAQNATVTSGVKKEGETCEEAKKEEKTDEEKEEEAANSALKLIILETIGKCWPFSSEIQEKYFFLICLLIVDNLNKVTWSNQMMIIKSMDSILSKWSIELDESNFDVIIHSIETSTLAVISCIAKTTYSNLRRDGVYLLERVVNTLKKGQENRENWERILSNATVDSQIEQTTTFRYFILSNIVDSLRVLFEDFILKETANLDIKEKSKSIVKILNTNF